MKNAPDSEENILLNAALADDEWQALSASIKRRSLESLRRHRRFRRSWQGGLAAALLLTIITGAWWARHSAPVSPRAVAAAPVQPAPGIPHMTDEQMLALFPKGSCAIVEIGGSKQLVFFDRNQAEQGYMLSKQ